MLLCYGQCDDSKADSSGAAPLIPYTLVITSVLLKTVLGHRAQLGTPKLPVFNLFRIHAIVYPYLLVPIEEIRSPPLRILAKIT